MAASGPSIEEGYQLRCSLLGHTADVRAVATTTTGDIVTASRDKLSKLWTPEDGKSASFTCTLEYSGHSGYVNSVCCTPPDKTWATGLIATGSRDSTVLVYRPEQATAFMQLTGHTDTVSCISQGPGILISGSWDHTARVWSTASPPSDISSDAATTGPSLECVAVLKAHTGPLWATASLRASASGQALDILTAAADKIIILWRNYKLCRKFSGHTDCVRDLAVIDCASFLSCANDASVRRWDVATAACLGVYYGHTNFVYSVCVLRSSDGSFTGFASGGEDRSVRVWGCEGNHRQTISLPCQSAWAIAALPNSDIVVGSSDGACRVFTTAPARMAEAAERTALAEAVAALTRPTAADLGGVEPDKLPDSKALDVPGKSDGQTLLVREDSGAVTCYKWDAAEGSWKKVGEVVGAAGATTPTSGKVLHEGREYDYVFSVELDEGGKLKLPYNASDDPYMSAQTFIERHDLPQDHLDQVAQFIITNAGLGTSFSPSAGYVDPFTGGTRYTPSGEVASSSSSGGRMVDPFTSGSCYVPEDSTAPTPTKDSTHSTHYPQTTSLLFEASNEKGITAKFKENNLLVDESVRLTDAQIKELLSGIFTNDSADSIKPECLGPLENALQWSPQQVWPSLDLLRLCLRSRVVQDVWVVGDKGGSIVSLLISLIAPPASTATQLLAIRCLANLAAHPPGCQQLAAVNDTLLAAVVKLAPFPNKNLEIAAATLLLNCAVLLTKKTKELSELCQLLSGLSTLLVTCHDHEALYRALVGVGTVVSTSDDCRQFAATLDLAPVLAKLSSANTSSAASNSANTVEIPLKVQQCAQQVHQLIIKFTS